MVADNRQRKAIEDTAATIDWDEARNGISPAGGLIVLRPVSLCGEIIPSVAIWDGKPSPQVAVASDGRPLNTVLPEPVGHPQFAHQAAMHVVRGIPVGLRVDTGEEFLALIRAVLDVLPAPYSCLLTAVCEAACSAPRLDWMIFRIHGADPRNCAIYDSDRQCWIRLFPARSPWRLALEPVDSPEPLPTFPQGLPDLVECRTVLLELARVRKEAIVRREAARCCERRDLDSYERLLTLLPALDDAPLALGEEIAAFLRKPGFPVHHPDHAHIALLRGGTPPRLYREAFQDPADLERLAMRLVNSSPEEGPATVDGLLKIRDLPGLRYLLQLINREPPTKPTGIKRITESEELLRHFHGQAQKLWRDRQPFALDWLRLFSTAREESHLLRLLSGVIPLDAQLLALAGELPLASPELLREAAAVVYARANEMWPGLLQYRQELRPLLAHLPWRLAGLLDVPLPQLDLDEEGTEELVLSAQNADLLFFYSEGRQFDDDLGAELAMLILRAEPDEADALTSPSHWFRSIWRRRQRLLDERMGKYPPIPLIRRIATWARSLPADFWPSFQLATLPTFTAGTSAERLFFALWFGPPRDPRPTTSQLEQLFRHKDELAACLKAMPQLVPFLGQALCGFHQRRWQQPKCNDPALDSSWMWAVYSGVPYDERSPRSLLEATRSFGDGSMDKTVEMLEAYEQGMQAADRETEGAECLLRTFMAAAIRHEVSDVRHAVYQNLGKGAGLNVPGVYPYLVIRQKLNGVYLVRGDTVALEERICLLCERALQLLVQKDKTGLTRVRKEFSQ